MEINSDLDISVEEGVYRPDDDSYLLVSLIEINKGDSVLEIGCGSGVISIHCALAGGKVTVVDTNDEAAKLTKINAKTNGAEIQNVLVGDMFEPIKGDWDVMIFNPPYLPKIEGSDADFRWDGGERGDETILRFLEKAQGYMHDDSRLYLCCSDVSPMGEIDKLFQRYYKVRNGKEKRYDFETLYAFELRKETS